MKQPQYGNKSTTPKPIKSVEIQPEGNVTHHIPNAPAQAIPIQMPPPPAMHNYTGPNIIGDDDDNASIANVFCFGAFTDNKVGLCTMTLTETSRSCW